MRILYGKDKIFFDILERNLDGLPTTEVIRIFKEEYHTDITPQWVYHTASWFKRLGIIENKHGYYRRKLIPKKNT